jgi:hypothetical protein
VQSKIEVFKESNRRKFSDKLLCISEKLNAYQKYINKEPPKNKIYENEEVGKKDLALDKGETR